MMVAITLLAKPRNEPGLQPSRLEARVDVKAVRNVDVNVAAPGRCAPREHEEQRGGPTPT